VNATSANQPPNPGTISGGSPVDEGTTSVYTSSASDPDLDPLSYTWSISSGNASISSGQGTNSVTLSFTDGPSTVLLHLIDKDGGKTTYGGNADVRNVAPTATFSNNGPINEGGSATVSFTSPSDPSTADTSAGFHYAYACDNGSLASATYGNSGASATTSC